MKFIIGISMMVCLLMVAWCSKEQPVAPAYFDCEYYNYFPNDTFPVITTQDSLAVAELFSKLRRRLYSNSSIIHFFNYITNKIDTTLLNYYVVNRDGLHSLKPVFGSLTSRELSLFLYTDAIITGYLVDSRDVVDTNNCYYFKTQEVLQCKEVLFSNFDLKRGDYILTTSIDGIVGGCSPGGAEVRSFRTHKKSLAEGKEELFILSKNLYRGLFVEKEFVNNTYNDIFCNNMLYIVNMYEEDIQIENTEKIKSLKKFVKKMYNEK
ncbi:MAG TPA: hypothetical protein PK239_00380 [Chitinophagales bacterium]|nr:hypothetical protein [Chitinophagales bacterium]